MSVFALMCTKNEADRYLECVLTHLVPLVDGVVVYDDRSDDATAAVAKAFTPWVEVRDMEAPSFIDDESAVHSAAWSALGRLANPGVDDWVLLVDADEIVVNTSPTLDGPRAVRALIEAAELDGKASAMIPVDEAFNLDPIEIRVDGWWGRLSPVRLCRWRPDAEFKARPKAAPSCPTYATADPHKGAIVVRILHLGYAHPADRAEKFDRYRATKGHNPSFVRSIRASGRRQPAEHPVEVWRGVRQADAPPSDGLCTGSGEMLLDLMAGVPTTCRACGTLVPTQRRGGKVTLKAHAPPVPPNPHEGTQTAMRLHLADDWPSPTSRVRRVGWLDQKGRVWAQVPPGGTFDGGSLTALLVEVGD